MVAQDLWDAGKVEEVVLRDDYFYRAEKKYDLYLGHPWLRKNRVAPVGHGRCFLLESNPFERPEFRFLHAGFRSAEEFLKQKVTPIFGEEVTIAEVNGSVEYSRELECLCGDSQPRRPWRWHSSSYRVVDEWRDAICEYFYEHHSFTPQYDAFANRENKRFDNYFRDTWTQKWYKKLWMNPPFHLIQQVIHKIKQDKTQAILVVPLWDDKPWFQELQDICVNYIELRGRLSCTPGTTQVPCESAPGVRLHSCWKEGFLTLSLLILRLTLVLGQNLRLRVVLMMNVFFPIFLRQMRKVIRRQLDPPRLPLPQYDRHQKESSLHGRRKILNRAANSEFFLRKTSYGSFQ